MVFEIIGYQKKDFAMNEVYLMPVCLIKAKKRAPELLQQIGIEGMNGLLDKFLNDDRDKNFIATLPMHDNVLKQFKVGDRLQLQYEKVSNGEDMPMEATP